MSIILHRNDKYKEKINFSPLPRIIKQLFRVVILADLGVARHAGVLFSSNDL